MLNGYKTYVGAVIMALSVVLPYLGVSIDAEALLRLGESLGLVGLGHKLTKAQK